MNRATTYRLYALTLSVAGALGACSLAPRYDRPAAPIATSFPSTVNAAPAARPASEIPWREFFTEPRLVKLIELAIANNRDLRLAALNVERTRAQYQIQRAEQLPTVNATAQGVTQRSSGALSPSGVGFRLEYFQAGLAMTSYELDFFGRVRSLSDSALATYFSTEEAASSAQISLVAAVASTWLNLVANHDGIAIARQTAESREQSLKTTKLRFDNGVVSALDVRLAETLVEAARASVAQLKRQRDLDRNALSLLLGQPLPAEYINETLGNTTLESPQMLTDVPVGLPSDLLNQRPDIRSAEQQLIAANTNIGAARAAMFPRISLTAAFGSASTDLSSLLSAPNRTFSLIPGAAFPLFDGGRARANVDVASVGRDIALVQYERSIQTAFREVADALVSRTAVNDQLKAQQAQQSAELERLKLTEARFKGGVSNSLEVLDAQRSLFTVQQQVIQTRLLGLQAQVNLYKALGGGWTMADRLSSSRADAR